MAAEGHHDLDQAVRGTVEDFRTFVQSLRS